MAKRAYSRIRLWIYAPPNGPDLGVPVNNSQRSTSTDQNDQSTLGKLMISLSDRAEDMVREEVLRVYHGRVGGLSIFFEQILRDYFQHNGKPKSLKNGKR